MPAVNGTDRFEGHACNFLEAGRLADCRIVLYEGGDFLMTRLQLRSLLCEEPATSFGDDIEIFVNGLSAGGQFPIDQGQSRDLSRFDFDFDGQAFVTFEEDSDPGGDTTVLAALMGQGVQRREVRIKEDGRYQLFFEVIAAKPITFKNKLLLRSLLCTEPATSFGDDIEIFVNGLSAGGQFPIDQGQFRDLSEFNFDFDGRAIVNFKEDSDPAGDTVIDASLTNQGVQRRDIQIKDDGRYQLFFEVLQN
jgi:hypothetical protein